MVYRNMKGFGKTKNDGKSRSTSFDYDKGLSKLKNDLKGI